jgi:MerR family transcriptional regulator, redox-sensitive transcriptional activator SoxR
MKPTDLLTIGELARRTGIAVSAIRYYEDRGLIASLRTAGNQRRYLRADIRRLSFILIAQRLGLSLDAIAAELGTLPAGRTPSRADWTATAQKVRAELERQIALLEQTRDNLDGCIGCGCLSLDRCALYNAGDSAAAHGPGPRYTMGDRAKLQASSG